MGIRSEALRGVTVALAVAFVFVSALPAAAQDADVWRIAGPDRFATAVAAAESKGYFRLHEPVLVATGQDFADALAAGPAAYGPHAGDLLLTARDRLPEVTTNRLEEEQPSTVYLVGGRETVSEDVEAQLLRYAGDVVRVAGPTRYHTTAAVSETFFDTEGDVVLATGEDYPDALAGTPLARRVGGPVLLTGRDALPSPTEEELRRLAPDRVFVMGGTAAVSEAVVDRIRQVTGANVPRVAGANRYETAAEAAELVGGLHVFAATGQDFPDALAGGALAGMGPNPVLLVARDHAPQPTLTELHRRDADEITIFGGTAAVSERTENQLAHYRRTDCPPEPGSPC